MSENNTLEDGNPIPDDYDHDTSTDAKGFANRIFGRKTKHSVPKTEIEQTDSTQRVPRYNVNYAAGGHRGIAVIINNENFHWTTGMNQRKGTEADERNLSRLFHKLDFDVKIYRDVSVHQIRKIVSGCAAMNHAKYDCFFMVFLSHGDNGVIYGTDNTIEIKPLTDMFSGKHCPSLIGKPKVFIFQACRGYKHEDPVHDGGDVVDGFDHDVVVDAGVAPTLPNASDFLFCYSVTEGKMGATRYDILNLLTLVNFKVSRKSVERTRNPQALGKKQMPCFLSMLTKQFFLWTKKEQ